MDFVFITIDTRKKEDDLSKLRGGDFMKGFFSLGS